MTEQISHTEAHEIWSEKQLVLFSKMKMRDRLIAVKCGALENWTDATRAAALDLLGDNETKIASSPSQKTLRFESARHPLLPQSVRSARTDWFMIAAGSGWAAIMIAIVAHVHGLF